MNKYCCWKNTCGTYTCCHFCKKITKCEYKCTDDINDCKYITDVDQAKIDKAIHEALVKPTEKKQESTGPKLLKISEVAKQLNVKYDDIYLLVTTNRIKTIRVNNRYFIEETTINEIKQNLQKKNSKQNR